MFAFSCVHLYQSEWLSTPEIPISNWNPASEKPILKPFGNILVLSYKDIKHYPITTMSSILFSAVKTAIILVVCSWLSCQGNQADPSIYLTIVSLLAIFSGLDSVWRLWQRILELHRILKRNNLITPWKLPVRRFTRPEHANSTDQRRQSGIMYIKYREALLPADIHRQVLRMYCASCIADWNGLGFLIHGSTYNNRKSEKVSHFRVSYKVGYWIFIHQAAMLYILMFIKGKWWDYFVCYRYS